MTINGFGIIYDSQGLPIGVGPPLVEPKKGACHCCGAADEELVVHYIRSVWAGETCRHCAEVLSGGPVKTRFCRFKQEGAV